MSTGPWRSPTTRAPPCWRRDAPVTASAARHAELHDAALHRIMVSGLDEPAPGTVPERGKGQSAEPSFARSRLVTVILAVEGECDIPASTPPTAPPGATGVALRYAGNERTAPSPPSGTPQAPGDSCARPLGPSGPEGDTATTKPWTCLAAQRCQGQPTRAANPQLTANHPHNTRETPVTRLE